VKQLAYLPIAGVLVIAGVLAIAGVLVIAGDIIWLFHVTVFPNHRVFFQTYQHTWPRGPGMLVKHQPGVKYGRSEPTVDLGCARVQQNDKRKHEPPGCLR